MDTNPEATAPEPSLIDKLENLDRQATGDFLDGDYRPAKRGISSAAKLIAFDLLNADTSTGERKLMALVDAVTCLLDHSDGHGAAETARLAFETVAHPAVALKAVRALTAG